MILRLTIVLLMCFTINACTEQKTEKEVMNIATEFCGSVQKIQTLYKYSHLWYLRCDDARVLSIKLEK